MVESLPVGNVLSIPEGHLPFGNDWHDAAMECYLIRQKQVRALIDGKYGGSYAAFADAIDIAPTTVSRWFMKGVGRKNIGEKSARKIENKLGLPDHALDHIDVASVIQINKKAQPSDWPFQAELLRDFVDLERDQKAQIGEIVEDRVRRFKEKNGPKRRTKSDEGRAR